VGIGDYSGFEKESGCRSNKTGGRKCLSWKKRLLLFLFSIKNCCVKE